MLGERKPRRKAGGAKYDSVHADLESYLDDESRLMLMLDRAVAISREHAEVRAQALRAVTKAQPTTGDREELERELATLQARLARWEERQQREQSTPKKQFMIRTGRARVQALSKAIARMKAEG
jgi:predicted outer membrane protein